MKRPCTNSIAEIGNSLIEKARKDDLLNFLDWLSQWEARQLTDRQEEGVLLLTGNRILTNYARDKYGQSMYRARMDNCNKKILCDLQFKQLHPDRLV